jgi:hypothetical protein
VELVFIEIMKWNWWIGFLTRGKKNKGHGAEVDNDGKFMFQAKNIFL